MSDQAFGFGWGLMMGVQVGFWMCAVLCIWNDRGKSPQPTSDEKTETK